MLSAFHLMVDIKDVKLRQERYLLIYLFLQYCLNTNHVTVHRGERLATTTSNVLATYCFRYN